MSLVSTFALSLGISCDVEIDSEGRPVPIEEEEMRASMPNVSILCGNMPSDADGDMGTLFITTSCSHGHGMGVLIGPSCYSGPSRRSCHIPSSPPTECTGDQDLLLFMYTLSLAKMHEQERQHVFLVDQRNSLLGGGEQLESGGYSGVPFTIIFW